MNWKEFFRPGKRKIVLTLIFISIESFIISLFFTTCCMPPYYNFISQYMYCCEQFLNPKIVDPKVTPSSECLDLRITPEFCENFEEKVQERWREKVQLENYYGILIIILVLLINYFLSCLIVWIYNKVRKK